MEMHYLNKVNHQSSIKILGSEDNDKEKIVENKNK